MVGRFVLRRIDTREFEAHRNRWSEDIYWINNLREAYIWVSYGWAKDQQASYQRMGIETEIVDLQELEVLW